VVLAVDYPSNGAGKIMAAVLAHNLQPFDDPKPEWLAPRARRAQTRPLLTTSKYQNIPTSKYAYSVVN
jgi:hypothetical protein